MSEKVDKYRIILIKFQQPSFLWANYATEFTI
jgi:hypothetical protein